MIQVIDASKAGMRALAFKDHWNVSAMPRFSRSATSIISSKRES